MSHEMVALPPPAPRATDGSTEGRISWSDVWHAASLGQPFRPVLAAVLLMVMGLSMLGAYNDSVVRGLMYAVIGGVLIVVVLGLLGRLVSPRLREMELGARTTVLIISTASGMAAVAIAWALIMTAAGSEHPWRVPIALIIVGPVLVLALAAEQGFRQQVESANAELVATNARLQYGAAVAGAAAWHEERRLSRALHGPVQTAVRVAAMRIEQGDLAGAEHILLDALGSLEPDQHQTGVRDTLVGVARAWDGLCAVEVDLPDGLAARIDDNPPLAASVVDICTDACSNAVRHGGATRVAMRALPMGDTLELVVSDDGAPDTAAGLPGLSSAMLDDVSITWLRHREDGRTVLRATLPLGGRRATAA
jgi:signal transduction histidine kinase